MSFSYSPDRSLIEQLNINVKSGQKVAIVGPTGAGKSTMINLFMRFYDVTAGQITLDGVPISQYSREDLRRQIGMVLQETWIKSGTIHDNIAYGYPNATRNWSLRRNADFFIRQLPQGTIQFWQMEVKPYPRDNVSFCLLRVSLLKYLKS